MKGLIFVALALFVALARAGDDIGESSGNALKEARG